MKSLLGFFEGQKRHFKKGGKLEKFYPLFEMIDTFIFSPAHVTPSTSHVHVRDALDLKRVMITVGYALIPCVIMAMANTGYQANKALATLGTDMSMGGGVWRAEVMASLGLAFDHNDVISNFVHGALYFLPVFLVTNIVGGLWETLFAIIRRHEINEGFLVTGILFPLTLPPTIPLWQVAIGISFGVVLGKEVFGGTGRNIFNPALMSRAFLFFAYPAQMSGDAVWTAVDGYTGATPLGKAAAAAAGGGGGLDAITATVTWEQAFLGFIPGSMGETSTLACLIGAALLITTGIASWKVMASATLGILVMSFALNTVAAGAAETANPMFTITAAWHFVLGGGAFAIVFMATDPVSGAMTETGKWIYGLLIGMLAITIRCLNPAYPEGWMLAILFMNAFAPLIDHFVVKAHIKRRRPAKHVP